MDCQTVRELYVASLLGPGPGSVEVDRHLVSCPGCREELLGVAATWAALGDLPRAEPSPAVARRLRRRLRLEAAREALGSLAHWQQAALVGVVGFVVSVLLSLVVPYDTIVALCREIVPSVLPTPGAYLVAGVVYGLVPMALGSTLLTRLLAPHGLVGALEAAAVFLAVLLPYAVLLCGEFPLALLIGFLGGITAGAVAGSLAGTWLTRRPANMEAMS